VPLGPWKPHHRRLIGVVSALVLLAAFFLGISYAQETQTPVWILAFAAVLASFMAICGESIRNWIWRPSLVVRYSHDSECCDQAVMRPEETVPAVAQAEVAYYFRLRISNNGSRRAETVEVQAKDLFKRMADGRYMLHRRYAMNLKWTHMGTRSLPGLSPGLECFCDIGHILRPLSKYVDAGIIAGANDTSLFTMDVEAQPYNRIHVLEPGQYRLTLLVSAANHAPVAKTVDVDFTGDWYDEMATMLAQGVRIRLADGP
jgi:hypothetical protein